MADLEHDIVGADGDRALVENELRRCQHDMDDMVHERDQAQTAIHELQSSLAEVEAQLAATVDDYTSLLGTHGSELAQVKLQLFQRDSQILLQTEQIRLETDKVAKLEGELKTTHLILASQEGEVATLKDKIGTMRFEANEKMFEARAEIDGLKRDVEDKDAEVEEMSEEMRVMREEQERGDRERGEVSHKYAILDIADHQLLQEIYRLRADEGNAANFQETVHDLESQLSTLTYRIRELEAELEDRSHLLDSRSLLSTSQGGEIAHLRGQLATTEEALYEAQQDLKRQGKSLIKLQDQLAAQSSDGAQEELRVAHEQALVQVEMEKARAEDAKSRLNAFGAEMDRVALSETRLKDEIASLRQRSASDEMVKMELEKKVQRLEDDKELLNVALESKQTELALVVSARIRPPSTPCTSSSRTMFSSTSRASHDVTPRALASSTTSIASTTAKATRRESSIINPSPTKRLAPLGTSTRHNKTPEKQKSSSMATKIVISTSKPKPKSQIPISEPVVTRRSSLPVLRRPVSVAAEKKRVSDLKEEDEDLFA